MKNTIAGIIAISLLIFFVLGCSNINPFAEKTTNSGNRSTANSNKSLTDKAVDTAVGEQKIGIPECDEVMDLLAAELNNPDDGYIVKAGKAIVVNQIRDTIKRSIEENKGDKVELAKKCTEAKAELEKAKKEQSNK